MKKTTLALMVILLSGCGYDYGELEAARNACSRYGGEFEYGVTGQTITATYCTVNKVRYRIGRTEYKLHEGKVL